MSYLSGERQKLLGSGQRVKVFTWAFSIFFGLPMGLVIFAVSLNLLSAAVATICGSVLGILIQGIIRYDPSATSDPNFRQAMVVPPLILVVVVSIFLAMYMYAYELPGSAIASTIFCFLLAVGYYIICLRYVGLMLIPSRNKQGETIVFIIATVIFLIVFMGLVEINPTTQLCWQVACPEPGWGQPGG
jgi:hypothetical protein